MSLLNDLGRLLIGDVRADMTAARSAAYEYPDMDTQLAVIRNRDVMTWRGTTVKDALSVPAIFGAVSLISNTVGSLSLEAYRKGIRLDQADAPRLMLRPNPFTTLRAFLRDTAFHLATRGEAWWWIAVRDPIDGQPLSLVPAPPWEITVEQNDRNRLRPTIRWNDRIIPNEDMRQITYMPGRDGRGAGPLQLCGAAVSVSVEAQEWAANFFSGSVPSIVGTTDQDMTSDELKAMDAQWMEKPPNFPRWLTNGLALSESPFDPEKAQLDQSRQSNVGDVARMFNIPGTLIEYQMSGQSLHYQNDQSIWTDFQRRCLSPNYLEPIEQEISDLLTRSLTARFNLKQLLRASAKERAEVHKTFIEAGVYGPEIAAQEEGYAPGSVDYAPVPLAAPQAIPNLLAADRPRSVRTELAELRCPKCRKLAGRVAGAAEIMCARCGTMVAA